MAANDPMILVDYQRCGEWIKDWGRDGGRMVLELTAGRPSEGGALFSLWQLGQWNGRVELSRPVCSHRN